jgi:hypothetical protein
MSTALRRSFAVVAALAMLTGLLVAVIDRALQAAANEWAVAVHVGPFERRWQVAKTARVARLAVVARALDGRSLPSSLGTWTLRRSPTGELRAECEPCVIRARALGSAPLRLDRVVIQLVAAQGDDYAGRVWIGREDNAVPVSWRARLDPLGLVLDASGDALPIAALVASVEPRLPELQRARIEGTFGFTLRYGGDPGAAPGTDAGARLLFEPRVEGLRVSGLGTEQLLNAMLPENCGPLTLPLRGWLPIAVIAAEDQTFASHAGFDLKSLRGALLTNADADSGTLSLGASTLTQQLAKLVYTGDSRDPVRKLRELLYAVEMERTLGKARVLQLYLALAPWGRGACGAESAARQFLGKSASRLDPLEAAWLAGLLRNPDAALSCALTLGAIDTRRTAWVVDQMRPMAAWRRARTIEALSGFEPPAVRAVAARHAPASDCRTRSAAGPEGSSAR